MEDKKSKEIDLLDLLQSIGKSIHKSITWCYDAFWWLIVFGIKNYIVIGIVSLLGAAWGIYTATTSSNSYKSEMIFRSNAIRSYEMIEYLNNITSTFSQKNAFNYPIIEQQFGLDSTTISSILSIKAHFFIDYWGDGTRDEIDYDDKHSTKDTINIRDSIYLCVEAIVNDPNVFNQISPAVTRYLNNQPFLQSANKSRIERLKENIALTKIELKYLDSLQKVSYFDTQKTAQLQLNNRSGLILGENRQQLYHTDKHNMQQNLNKLMEEFERYPGISTVVDDFQLVTTKMNTSYSVILKCTIIAGFLSYLLLLCIYFFKHNYKNYIDRV